MNQMLIEFQGGSWCQPRKSWGKYHREVNVETPTVWIMKPKFKWWKMEIRKPDGTVTLETRRKNVGFQSTHTWDVRDTQLIPGKEPVIFESATTDWGAYSYVDLQQLLKIEDSVDVVEKRASFDRYGSIGKSGARFKMTINNQYCYADVMLTIVHELAHLYHGHVGKKLEIGEKRKSLADRETEAELTTCIASNMLVGAIDESSKLYLSNYAKHAENPINYWDCYLVADRIAKKFNACLSIV